MAVQCISLTTFLAFVTALIGAADLAFNPSHKARDHQDLYRSFRTLLAKNQNITNHTIESIAAWKNEHQLICVNEPPVYMALANHIHNEVMRIENTDEKRALMVKINKWQMWTMNWLLHTDAEFQKVS
jgi:hypothetical protein